MTDLAIAPAPGALFKPDARPARPHFSSGPCAKPPGWDAAKLATASLGRSHRSKIGKARLARAIDLTREVLEVPDTHRIAIVPGSDTGAVELAMWNLLGSRAVTVLAWEHFGQVWVTDALKQLRLDPKVMTAPYGDLPDLADVDFASDVVFTWNGTASGVRVPGGDWIAADRAGLTIVDATSACFAQRIAWDKCDVVTFSWQKVMGGEAAHGMLILGPRAVERLESFTPDRPLPKLFRIVSNGKLDESVFRGETINTPSLLATEDYIAALEWARAIGGLDELIARAERNAAALDAWVGRTGWVDYLARDPVTRSGTSVCLRFAELSDAEARAVQARMVALLEEEGAAYDVGAYRDAPPGLRVWCGATVDTADIVALGPWLDWAYATVKA